MQWFFDRWKNRDSPENPATSLSNPASWLWDAFGARKSSTGVVVTPTTALETLSLWAAVRMISSTIATLPLHTFRKTAQGKERAIDDPSYRLLHSAPNPEITSFLFFELALAHLLIFGNFFAEVERDGSGAPLALWPLFPTSVSITRIAGEKLFIVRVEGKDVALPAANVLHVPGFSLDGCSGLVPINVARNAIGLASATEQFAAAFFQNGASISGLLSHPGKLTAEGTNNLRDSWAKLHAGLTNAQRVAVLEEGMTWTQTGSTSEEGQMLGVREFQVTEIARLFLIPPHLLAELSRSTFSNIESQQISFAQTCIAPWCRRIEQSINATLFADGELFAEFSLEGMLRGDSASRAAWFTSMANLGVYSVNEIRALENLNAIEGGDTRLVPLNMAPLPTSEAA